jgi:hypothetical protein
LPVAEAKEKRKLVSSTTEFGAKREWFTDAVLQTLDAAL